MFTTCSPIPRLPDFSVCNIEILGTGHGNETRFVVIAIIVIIIEVDDGHMT